MLPELDLVMAAAWTPAISEQHDAWVLRSTSGITRRANSCLVLGSPDYRDGAIAEAERFYASAGQPSIFMISTASVPASGTDRLASDNVPSHTLFSTLGFTKSHSYSYWIR